MNSVIAYGANTRCYGRVIKKRWRMSWRMSNHLKVMKISDPSLICALHISLEILTANSNPQTHFSVGTTLCCDFITLSRYHWHLPWTLLRLFRRSCSGKERTETRIIKVDNINISYQVSSQLLEANHLNQMGVRCYFAIQSGDMF